MIDLRSYALEKNGFTAAWRSSDNNHPEARERLRTSAAKVALCPGTHIGRQIVANRIPIRIYDALSLQAFERRFGPLVGLAFLLRAKFRHLQGIGGVHGRPA
jgi:hypothetical protein